MRYYVSRSTLFSVILFQSETRARSYNFKKTYPFDIAVEVFLNVIDSSIKPFRYIHNHAHDLADATSAFPCRFRYNIIITYAAVTCLAFVTKICELANLI